MSKPVLSNGLLTTLSDHERRIEALERRIGGGAEELVITDQEFNHPDETQRLNKLNYRPGPPAFGWKVGPEGLKIVKSEDSFQIVGSVRWTGEIPQDWQWAQNESFDIQSLFYYIPTAQWGPGISVPSGGFRGQQMHMISHEADGSDAKTHLALVFDWGGYYGQFFQFLINDDDQYATGGTGFPLRPGAAQGPSPSAPGGAYGTTEGRTLQLNTVVYSQKFDFNGFP